MLSQLYENTAVLLQHLECPIRTPLVTGLQGDIPLLLVLGLLVLIQSNSITMLLSALPLFQVCHNSLIYTNSQRTNHPPRPLDSLISMPHIIRKRHGSDTQRTSRGRNNNPTSPLRLRRLGTPISICIAPSRISPQLVPYPTASRLQQTLSTSPHTPRRSHPWNRPCKRTCHCEIETLHSPNLTPLSLIIRSLCNRLPKQAGGKECAMCFDLKKC
jgi:hypothetical protein